MRTLLLALALLGLCASAQAQTRSADADRAAIEALEQRWLAHLTDPAALEDILANDFAHPVAAGIVLNKRQHIDWARAHPTPPGVIVRFETLDVRLYGDVAVATGITARREGGNAASARFSPMCLPIAAGAGWR